MSDTNQATIRAYDENVQKYLEGTPKDVTPEVREWLDDLLAGLDVSAKILEIGTASGRDADYVESKGYHVLRSDASRAFVDLQVSRGHKASQINLLTDSIGKGYDAIIANAVLLHFTEQELLKALAKINEALKATGRVAFSLKQGKGEELTDRKLDATRYFHYWAKGEIEQVLSAAGFRVVTNMAAQDYRGKAKPDWMFIIARKDVEK